MNVMKRKAEENLTPSTPDTQKGWLKTRSTSRTAPNSPPDGPPSPTPQRLVSQKTRKKNLGMNPDWTQLGGIAQAGQAGQQSMDDDYLGSWVDSFNANASNSNSGNGNVNFDVQDFGNPSILVTGPNDTDAFDDMFAFDTLLQNTSGRYNIDDTLNVPTENFFTRKRSRPAANTNTNTVNTEKLNHNHDLNPHNQPLYHSSSVNHSNPITNFTDPIPLTNSSSSSVKPTHLPSSTSNFNTKPLPLRLLPSINPNRSLQLSDEVHLLDNHQSDPSGQITYKITHIDSHGVYTIVPLPVSLRCEGSRLLRAPLGEGDIVSVFVNDASTGVNGESGNGDNLDMGLKQDDWGAITRRWVINGERRYNVVSWDERFAGRLWEGLRDDQVGQYDLDGTVG